MYFCIMILFSYINDFIPRLQLYSGVIMTLLS